MCCSLFQGAVSLLLFKLIIIVPFSSQGCLSTTINKPPVLVKMLPAGLPVPNRVNNARLRVVHIFPQRSRASETRARVNITPREKGEAQPARALAFHSLYYPWGKMGTTRSLNHAGLVEKLTETSQKSAAGHPSWRFSSLSKIRRFWRKGRRERQIVTRAKGKKHSSRLHPQISSLLTP